MELLLQGRIQDFFLGGGTLVSCSTSTPINHIVYLYTSCIRKPQVISGGGAHPLHPPPRSASVLGATTGAGLLCKTALRGGQFDKNEFIKEMNLTDDKVVDFAPLITRFEKQCNETFLTA